MKWDKKLQREVMKWKVGGKWLNEREYLKYASAKDPHTTQKYWRKVHGGYRFRKSITDDEAQCYSQRYPDLQAAFKGDVSALKNHWLKHGRKEKRNKFCYTDMTEEETQCYLKRFPDVSFTNIKMSPKKLEKLAKKAKKKGEKFNPVGDGLATNPV